MANMRGGNAKGSLCCWMVKDLFYALSYLKKKKEDRSRNVEYSNTIFSGENGEDGSVQPNNASMIKMLTLTMHTKFLYACTCVWVSHHPTT